MPHSGSLSLCFYLPQSPCAYMQAPTYAHMHAHTPMHTCTRMPMCIHAHAPLHAQPHPCIHAPMRLCVHVCAYSHTHIHSYVPAWVPGLSSKPPEQTPANPPGRAISADSGPGWFIILEAELTLHSAAWETGRTGRTTCPRSQCG